MLDFAKWFNRKNEEQIGLHISSDMITAVQLGRHRRAKTFRVRAWASSRLPDGVIVEGNLMQADTLSTILKKMLANPNFGIFTTKKIVFSVQERQCYHSVFAEEKTVADSPYAIAYQNTMPHIPFAPDDIFWDWRVIAQDEKLDYFYTVAIPRDTIMPYLTLFAQHGLEAKVVEPEVLSTLRFFADRFLMAQPLVMLNIGRQGIAVTTVDELGIHQSSEVKGEGITHWLDELGSVMKAPRASLEKAVFQAGLREIANPKAAKIREVLTRGISKIAGEVDEHRDYYTQRQHHQTQAPQSLLIVGEGLLIQGLAKALSEKLKMKILPLQPIFKLIPAFSPAQRAVFHAAAGAALQNMDEAKATMIEINVLRSRPAVQQK